MNHDDPTRDVAPDDALDAGLRLAFGPESTGSVLAALEAGGVDSRLLLRDEPEEPAGIVQPLAGRGALGRYQVAGEIARGGIGIVLRGRDADLGRDVALKVLRAEHAANPAMVRRLVEEAQIGGQLQHPGVLPVYELGLDAAGRPFFAMRVVRGRTLAAILRDRAGPADDLQRLLAIFEQVAQAVAYAHARGVIHRDLKPSNVMVGAFGEVQVVDWGLAKVLARGTEPRSETGPSEAVATVRTGEPDSRSEAGSVLGTPAYMAPEQARGAVDELDERSDVFALGAILLEVLTGRPLYEGTRDEILRSAREARPDAALARLDDSGVDATLIDLARRCLAPEPAARPADAGQVARAVRTYLATSGERARAAEIDAAAARARAAAERRARRRISALAVALIAALLAVGWAFRRSEQERQGRLRAALDRQRAEASRQAAVAEKARIALDAERRKQRYFDAIAGILMASEAKGRYLITRSAHAPDRESPEWAEVLDLAGRVVERLATDAPDEATRRRADDLLQAIRGEADAARQRARADGPPKPNDRDPGR